VINADVRLVLDLAAPRGRGDGAAVSRVAVTISPAPSVETAGSSTVSAIPRGAAGASSTIEILGSDRTGPRRAGRRHGSAPTISGAAPRRYRVGRKSVLRRSCEARDRAGRRHWRGAVRPTTSQVRPPSTVGAAFPIQSLVKASRRRREFRRPLQGRRRVLRCWRRNPARSRAHQRCRGHRPRGRGAAVLSLRLWDVRWRVEKPGASARPIARAHELRSRRDRAARPSCAIFAFHAITRNRKGPFKEEVKRPFRECSCLTT